MPFREQLRHRIDHLASQVHVEDRQVKRLGSSRLFSAFSTVPPGRR
jgi:hypothetical protein